MYTTRTKPWVRAPVGCAHRVRAPPHRELKIAAPVQLCKEGCLLPLLLHIKVKPDVIMPVVVFIMRAVILRRV